MKYFFHSKPRSHVTKTKQSGFTLIEVVVTMGLMGMFLVVITDVVAATLDVQTESKAVSAVSEDGRFLLARLDYDIQRASAVTTPAALGDSGAVLTLTIGGVAHTYEVVGGNLQLTDGGGTSNLNSSGTVVSNLSFQKLGNVGGKETVEVTYTVESTVETDQGVRTRTYETTFGRRQ